MKCVESAYTMLGIKYLFEPAKISLKKQMNLVRILDLLKHAHELVSFVESFKEFLAKIYMAQKAQKVQLQRLRSRDAELYKVKFEDVFTAHQVRLRALTEQYNQICSNYYFELLFGTKDFQKKTFYVDDSGQDLTDT